MRDNHLILMHLKNKKKVFKMQKILRVNKLIQLEILWLANKEVKEIVLNFLISSKNRATKPNTKNRKNELLAIIFISI